VQNEHPTPPAPLPHSRLTLIEIKNTQGNDQNNGNAFTSASKALSLSVALLSFFCANKEIKTDRGTPARSNSSWGPVEGGLRRCLALWSLGGRIGPQGGLVEKVYDGRGLNPRSLACEANVLTTRRPSRHQTSPSSQLESQ
jgi:hypothetical protein